MSRYALLMSVVLISAGLAATPAFSQTAPTNEPVIVTQGLASVTRAPDQVWVSVAAEARAAKPVEAQRLAAAAMTAVQSALKGQGIAPDAIKTTSYSLGPEMEYGPGISRLKDYLLRNQIEVRVDALDKLGEVLDAVGSSGATSIAGLRFDVKERDTLEREALRMAVRNAMTRAEAIAAGAGRTLGTILKIEEQQLSVPGPRFMMAGASASGAQTPISPGEIEIRAQVTLTVAIR